MRRLSQLLGAAWSLTRPYFTSDDRWPALALITVLVALNLGQVFLSVLFNQWNNLFYTALQNKDWPTFLHQLIRFCWLAAAFIVAGVYQVYFNQMLQIRWRQWLTRRYLDLWLDRRAYYRMQLAGGATDNPDQRIADDLRLFTQRTLDLSLGLLSAVVTLVSFLGILWGLSGDFSVTLFGHDVVIPGYMVWFALGYAVLGTWLTNRIGRRLVRLNFDQQRYEADFRFGLVRVRENADAIALDRGEGSEKRGLVQRFAAVAGNWWGIMRAQKRLTWFTAGYSQIAIVFPFAVASPQYFFGKLELGGLMQTASAFGSVQGALSFFVTAYRSIAEWRAVIERLAGFDESIATARAAATRPPVIALAPSDAGIVSFKDLAVQLPNGAPLVNANDLSIKLGERVLVSGPSGSGKSTLFRALAGIWPFGKGTITVPKNARVMILPQRPYFPIATLAAAVAYPAEPDSFDAGKVAELIEAVGLPALASRIEEEAHWNRMLSLGEQQRLGIARALLYAPDFLFLDEATASLDEPAEAALYQLLERRLARATIVSIGHRATLAAFHKRRLAYSRDGDHYTVREASLAPAE